MPGPAGEREEPASSSSDAFEQVGVAVVPSAAVAQLSDAGPQLHGTAFAQTTLRQRKRTSSAGSHFGSFLITPKCLRLCLWALNKSRSLTGSSSGRTEAALLLPPRWR